MVAATLSVAYAQTGTWSGKLAVQGTSLTLVFHLDDENPTIDSPDQGARGISAQIERPGAGKVIVRIPSLGARYEGQWLIRQIVGTFTQMNQSFPLTLTPGENKPKRPQTPQGPFPYSQEEVTFANGDVVLQGTLVLPEGCTRETPALVMVTGSGIQNRDEELFEHKPFAVIADALARAGIATLRYDDRGFNGYDGNINDCTTDDFKNDALAGINMLRDRFDKVGVIGHSEGGTIALMLAAEKQADFIISLAGMAVSGAETLVWQNRLALVAAGLPEDAVDTYCRLIGDAFDAKNNGMPMPDASGYDLPDALKQNYLAVLAQLQTPYMSRFVSLDMRPLMGEITCPVMALNGVKDMQVEHELNLGAIRKGLPANEKHVIESIEGLNHLFQHCTTGATSEYRDIEETFAPEVLDRIINWLLRP
ncbi:MAG: alpha/beta fold hydrolase [Bacteroidales bacterium]|nr:alpha/beta fold hydrolase [Bacteroidales bacterium]